MMRENNVSALIAKEIERGETNRVEFKEDVPEEHKKVIKTAVAFSNSAGGHMIFGVTNDRTIVGIPDDVLFSKKDQITNMIVDSCEPMISPDIFITSIGGKNVIVVDILPGHLSPYHIKGEGVERGTYVRIGATSVPADTNMMKSLELRGMNMSFDNLDCPSAPIDDDGVQKLCDHLSSFGKPVTPVNLVNMGVVKRTLNDYTATNAYALLTNNPFLYARVQCARFRGTECLIFMDRKEYDGCIVDQVMSATDFVVNHINVGAKIKGVIRQDIYEIPVEAIREAVANAVIHRDYFARGVSIFVRVFDDRVEIESPGLSLGMDVNDPLSGRSEIRNEVIASVFKSIGVIEAYGTGIKKIIDACRTSGIPDPVFEEDSFYFKVTFKRAEAVIDGNLSRKDIIISAISTDGMLTQAEIAETTEIPYSTVKKIMRSLQKDGTIQRVTENGRSLWKVLR